MQFYIFYCELSSILSFQSFSEPLNLNYTPVCFHQVLESYLKVFSEHLVFTCDEALLLRTQVHN